MHTPDPKLHSLSNTYGYQLPRLFNNPFHYHPHPLVVQAAQAVSTYLTDSVPHLLTSLSEGKMLGVLVVETPDQVIGFLAAFSGNINGSNHYEYFVPPMFDLLDPNGYFVAEEAAISRINHQIELWEHDPEYLQVQNQVNQQSAQAYEELQQLKAHYHEAKLERNRLRTAGIDEATTQRFITESQFQKAELKRQQRRYETLVQELQQQLIPYTTRIATAKAERAQRSAQLQQRLFKSFVALNACGERKDLIEIFRNTAQGIPPAGAGECALPKLLQYAYERHYRPIASGEFWWGKSPQNGQVRHHGKFYPSCKGKCEPILSHMLNGLDVESPEHPMPNINTVLHIVYEDEVLLVVDKPPGLLSVPGKSSSVSVASILRNQIGNKSLYVVHRLDQDTSGLLVIAKNLDTYRILQQQFSHREVSKRYLALLDGNVNSDSGDITLPLSPDYQHRPLQLVDTISGKPALTHYQVLERRSGTTLIAFTPLTGRTHQLRVHAAHPSGLGCPILGDPLYGQRSSIRMWLHAAEIKFIHPTTGSLVHLQAPIEFPNHI